MKTVHQHSTLMLPPGTYQFPLNLVLDIAL